VAENILNKLEFFFKDFLKLDICFEKLLTPNFWKSTFIHLAFTLLT